MRKTKMSIFGVMVFTCMIFIVGLNASKLKAQQVDATWTTIDTSKCSESSLNNVINTLIGEGQRKFYILNGVYNLNGSIELNQPNVIIQGQSKECTKIVQSNPLKNSIEINSDGVQVSNLNVNNQSGGVAVSCRNSNNVNVQGCVIYGAQNDQAVVFSKDGGNDIQDVENSNLNMCNILEGNEIYSYFSDGGVLFSKQNHGTIDSNFIVGSRISFRLCRNSTVSYNKIKNSATNGIRYTVPAYSNNILGNIIRNTRSSGILVTREKPWVTPTDYRASGSKIDGNTINGSRYFGIEINNLKGAEVEGNVINNIDFNGIYILYSDSIQVVQNQIGNPNYLLVDGKTQNWDERYNSGIILDYMVSNSTLDKNIITNSMDNCPYGIRIQPDASNCKNTITNNIINGFFKNGISMRSDAPFSNIMGDGNVVNIITMPSSSNANTK
ncbi:S-layer protein [Clostridium acetobutylicum]|nr:S-layer protein [Clostridium acetobutylicum]